MIDKDIAAGIVEQLGRPIETACTLLENILGPPTKVFGEYLGDCVSYWQWENRINILEKVQKKVKEKKLGASRLPKDFVVPFLRECGDASEEMLKNWWAEMLMSAIEEEANCHVAYVHTLKAMSNSDVIFSEGLLRHGPFDKKPYHQIIAKHVGLSAEKAARSYNNLRRLGFFTATGRRLSGYAFDFMGVCAGDVAVIEEYRKRQGELRSLAVTD